MELTANLKLPTHGLFFLLAALISRQLARRQLDALERRHLDDSIPFLVLGATLGARFVYVMVRPSYWSKMNLWHQFWDGGMVSYGGLIGALLALYLFRLKRKLPMASLYDSLAPSMLIGWAVGRLGCLLNWYGEEGRPSNLPWAFLVNGESSHPVMLYLAILLLVAGLYLQTRPAPLDRPWCQSGRALCAFAFSRMLCDNWRMYDLATLKNLSQGFCLALIAVGLFLVHSTRRIPSRSVES